MADLKNRISRQVAERPASEPAFRSAAPTYEKRVTLDLTAADHAVLKDLAHEMRGTMADVLRAAIAVVREDEKVAARVRSRLS